MNLLQTMKERPLVCDGAMGTMLQRRGLPAEACPEIWALEHSDVLRRIHREYLDAGAEILLTPTFGANRFKLDKYNVSVSVVDLTRQLAAVTCELRDSRRGEGHPCYILGDIGPTGEFLKPLGMITEDEMTQAYEEQVRGLAEAGVDGLIIETMMDLNEARLAVKAAKRAGLPVIASMAYNPDPQGFRTMMGVSPQQATDALLEAGADVVGANCGSVLMEQMPLLVEQMKAAGATDVLVEANAGLPRIVDGQTVFSQTPQEMADSIVSVLQAGATLIGGCCGTTPEHIHHIAAIVQEGNA